MNSFLESHMESKICFVIYVQHRSGRNWNLHIETRGQRNVNRAPNSYRGHAIMESLVFFIGRTHSLQSSQWGSYYIHSYLYLHSYLLFETFKLLGLHTLVCQCVLWCWCYRSVLTCKLFLLTVNSVPLSQIEFQILLYHIWWWNSYGNGIHWKLRKKLTAE